MDGRNLTVRVDHGAVWITHQASTEDVVLETSNSFSIARDGLTLISVCGGAPFALVNIERNMPLKPLSRSSFAVRLLHWWAGLHAETTPRWHF